MKTLGPRTKAIVYGLTVGAVLAALAIGLPRHTPSPVPHAASPAPQAASAGLAPVPVGSAPSVLNHGVAPPPVSSASDTDGDDASNIDDDASSTSAGDGDEAATSDEEEGSASDDEEVDYFDPNTGKHSAYDLDVDRNADGKVERINFPKGGWKNVNGDTTDNGDGTETYTDPHGREYTIHKPDSDQNDPDQSTAN